MAKLLKKFVQSLQDCPTELQAKAVAVIRDLSADPLNAPGRHSLTPDSRALSPDVYKVRLNDGFRLVLQRVTAPRLEWLPIYAGRHEAVDRFVVRYQTVVDAEDRITILPASSESASAKKVPIRYAVHEAGLFDVWADADLIRLGIPADALGAVRMVREDADLDSLSKRVPDKIFERLLDWLTSPSERERAAILGLVAGTHKIPEANELGQVLEQPENYEEIVEFDEPEELTELLEKTPLEDWMIYLHPDQRAIVDRDFTGPARIRGVSGSGKRVILAHRAKRLARSLCKGQNDRILVLTHNRVLAGLLKDRLLPRLCGPELYHIEVNTIHGGLHSTLKALVLSFRTLNDVCKRLLRKSKRNRRTLVSSTAPRRFFKKRSVKSFAEGFSATSKHIPNFNVEGEVLLSIQSSAQLFGRCLTNMSASGARTESSILTISYRAHFTTSWGQKGLTSSRRGTRAGR